uniref:Uncharacterized protein n=1 Tax=Bartonella schoenbuchensis (strain DSM 13525 / NCTC 13165 / R1) TaxID=687861 RepID=E6Z118_BARSR|nr:exported hypothetical protein [Bartonella schoenbuchensis R1]
MGMRCVLKHHGWLGGLSTAVLAGLALITAQTKVYAKSLKWKGFTNTYGTGKLVIGVVIIQMGKSSVMGGMGVRVMGGR